MKIEARIASAVFDLIEAHQNRREPIVLAHLEAVVTAVVNAHDLAVAPTKTRWDIDVGDDCVVRGLQQTHVAVDGFRLAFGWQVDSDGSVNLLVDGRKATDVERSVFMRGVWSDITKKMPASAGLAGNV